MLKFSRKPHKAEASFRNRRHRFAQHSGLRLEISLTYWLSSSAGHDLQTIRHDSLLSSHRMVEFVYIYIYRESFLMILLVDVAWSLHLTRHFSYWSFNQTGVVFQSLRHWSLTSTPVVRTRFEGFGKEMQREISLIQDATQWHRWNLNGAPESRIQSQLEPPRGII